MVCCYPAAHSSKNWQKWQFGLSRTKFSDLHISLIFTVRYTGGMAGPRGSSLLLALPLPFSRGDAGCLLPHGITAGGQGAGAMAWHDLQIIANGWNQNRWLLLMSPEPTTP